MKYSFVLQDDAEQRTSTQGVGSEDLAADEDEDEDDNDEPVQGEEEDAGKAKGKTATRKQNEKLYTAEGILNPKAKRAEKKKRKKAKKSNPEDAMDDDYDFKVDYVKKTSMDVSDESDKE